MPGTHFERKRGRYSFVMGSQHSFALFAQAKAAPFDSLFGNHGNLCAELTHWSW